MQPRKNATLKCHLNDSRGGVGVVEGGGEVEKSQSGHGEATSLSECDS